MWNIAHWQAWHYESWEGAERPRQEGTWAKEEQGGWWGVLWSNMAFRKSHCLLLAICSRLGLFFFSCCFCWKLYPSNIILIRGAGFVNVLQEIPCSTRQLVSQLVRDWSQHAVFPPGSVSHLLYEMPVANSPITGDFSTPWKMKVPVCAFISNKIAELRAPLFLLQSLACLHPIFPLMVKPESLHLSTPMSPLR